MVQQVPGGAKPVTLTGKPLTQAKGQLVQIGGKGQQQLGLIQTPKGTINIIPQQTGTSGGIVTIPQSKTAGKLRFEMRCYHDYSCYVYLETKIEEFTNMLALNNL